MAQCIKHPVLPLQWLRFRFLLLCGFDPWPNFHTIGTAKKKKKKKPQALPQKEAAMSWWGVQRGGLERQCDFPK